MYSFLARTRLVGLFLAIILLLPAQGFCQNINNLFADAINSNGRTHGSAPTLNLLPVSQPISHASLKGIKVNPDNPFDLEFVIDTNNDKTINKEEAQTLVNYFFAGLTLPEKDLWVNLSPYEENRIIPDTTVTTQLGEGLLSQDYLLKQLAASLTYPETEIGKKYWDSINSVGANNHSPVHHNFNKVWITPDIAKVYENGNSAFITESTLKVLTEEDYLAMNKNNVGATRWVARNPNDNDGTRASHRLAPTDSFKKYILPQITQQVNQGEHFSQLRQIYNALILGVWFKNKLKDSIYKNYISQAKTKGIDSADINAKEKIYQKYLNAFKQGAYNYIKKERVAANGDGSLARMADGKRTVPISGMRITRRAYFSGGLDLPVSKAVTTTNQPPQSNGHSLVARVQVIINRARRAIGGYPQMPEQDAIENMLLGGRIDSVDTEWVFSHFYAQRDKLPKGIVEIVSSSLLTTEGLNYITSRGVKIVLPASYSMDLLYHELREAALRQQYPGKHWTEIHNMVCDEMNTPELKLNEAMMEHYRTTQNEIGAGMFDIFRKRFSANLSLEEYIDKAALDGIIGLHYRVVKSGASMSRRIQVYPTGIVIHFDDGQNVNIVFSFEKRLPEVAQAFRSKFENDFALNKNFDAGDVARSLLSMLSGSKKYDIDVQKMVDEIVSIVYQRGKSEDIGPVHPAARRVEAPSPEEVLRYVPQPSAPAPRFDIRKAGRVQLANWPRNIEDALDRLGVDEAQRRGKTARELLTGVVSLQANLSLNANFDTRDASQRAELLALLQADIVTCRDYLVGVVRGGGKGGAIGRWEYEDLIINLKAGTLTLINARRIPDKNGDVEKEFLSPDGKNDPHDIILHIRRLNPAEMLRVALLWQRMRIPELLPTYIIARD